MQTRRFILTSGLALLSGSFVPGVCSAAQWDAANFIKNLGNRALRVIRADLTLDQKRTYFRELLQEDFDIAGISRFVLGRYWRVASERQRQEFRRLLSDYLVLVYSRRLARYRGETLRVTGKRTIPDGVVVTSEIIRPNGAPPIGVDWRLEARDGLYRIEDVTIDRVSMALAERSECAAIIQRSGGQVAGLLTTLRKRTSKFG